MAAVGKRGARPASIVEPEAASRRPARARRSDAVVNRTRILDAAVAAFDEIGGGVSLDEIARRADVGAGTVHRHFPTKAALLDAAVASGVNELAAEAKTLTRSPEPVEAFCEFFERLVVRGAASHALADRLRDEQIDIHAAVSAPVADLRAAMATLLRRAQRAGGIRRDVDVGQLDALVAGAHAMYVHPDGGRRMIRFAIDAIRV